MRKRSYFLSFFFGVIFGNLAGIFNSSFFTFLLIPFVSFNKYLYSFNIILILKVLAIIIAPILEELTKLIPIFFLIYQERGHIININQWIILSILAALGFSTFENIICFITFISLHKLNACLLLIVLRYMLATPMHLSSTLVTSYGVGVWYLYGIRSFLIFIPIGVGIHSLHNLIITTWWF